MRLESEIRHIRLAVAEEKELFVGVEIVVLFELFARFGYLPDLRVMLQRELDGAEQGVVHPAIHADQPFVRQDIEHASEPQVSTVDENR